MAPPEGAREKGSETPRGDRCAVPAMWQLLKKASRDKIGKNTDELGGESSVLTYNPGMASAPLVSSEHMLLRGWGTHLGIPAYWKPSRVQLSKFQ